MDLLVAEFPFLLRQADILGNLNTIAYLRNAVFGFQRAIAVDYKST